MRLYRVTPQYGSAPYSVKTPAEFSIKYKDFIVPENWDNGLERISQKGFCHLMNEDIIIDIDFDISDDNGHRTLAFTEAMRCQIILRSEVRDNNLNTILDDTV